MPKEVPAHFAHTAWRLRKDKAILKLLPAILEKSNAQALGMVMMVLLAVAGSIGLGIAIDGYGIQHPLNLIGECPAGDIINANGCFQEVPVQVTKNGQTTETVQLQPAGTIVFPNGTAYGGT